MSQFNRTKAIVLRKTKYAEADLILSFLNTRGEKISCIARGALKSKKRFAGGILEPTHFLEIQYKTSSSKPDQLGVLEEAQLIDGFEKLRTDYDRLEVALFIVDCVYHIGQEGDSGSEALFNLTGHALKTLQEAKDLKKFKLHFMLKLLLQQGSLEPEEWMKAYLKLPMTDNENRDLIQDSKLGFHAIWAESQISEYLKRAEIF